MLPTTVTDTCLEMIKSFEGLHKVMSDGRIRSYRDPVGVWTIGYGHTKGVRSGQHITREEAEEFLREDIQVAIDAIHRLVSVPLSQRQFEALVSFVYNIGQGQFASSTLLRKLNKGEYNAVPYELSRWNKGTINGVKTELRGLTRRRAVEAAYFTGDTTLASQGGDKTPRKVSTASTKPLKKSRTIWGISVAGAATLVDTVLTQVAPIAGIHPAVDLACTVLQIAGIGLAAYARLDDHKNGVK